jgi:CRP/FNR family transcriptional regulator, cyclic AMP receptor protein
MEKNMKERLLSGWLGKIEPRLAGLILEKGQFEYYRNKETIYGFDVEQTCIRGIVSGHVRISVTMNEQAPQFGHLVGQGFWFGETEVVTGKKAIMEMMAVGDVEVFALNRRRIDEIAEMHTGMWPSLTLLAVLNQGLAIGVAEYLMLKTSSKRLAATLLRLSAKRNAYQEVPPINPIPVSWAELSDAANLSRSIVAKTLAEFSEQGLVCTSQRAIEIQDAKGLARLLEK